MHRNINKCALDIQSRFFEAIETLIEGHEITGLKEFCASHNLNRPKYAMLKNGCANSEEANNYRTIDIDALSYLCTEYGISAQWLLTGAGQMRKKNRK